MLNTLLNFVSECLVLEGVLRKRKGREFLRARRQRMSNCFRNSFLFFNFLSFFCHMAPVALWKFPGKGLNQSCSYGLYHSHSNTGFKTHLWPTSQPQQHHSLQQCWILNPLSEARDQTLIFMDTSLVLNPLNHKGNANEVRKLNQ